MRLTFYPYVIVRIACLKCPRKGAYRLARLADRYGAEAEMTSVLRQLAGDCKLSDWRRPGVEMCGTHFPDLDPREPDAKTAGRPRLRAVK